MNNGMDLNWNEERKSIAQKIVMERFAQNSVAGHLACHSTVDDSETTVKRNRFDSKNAIVIDREVFGLYEPFSLCKFSKAQMAEFSKMQQDDGLKQSKAVTTLTRAASRLARWHDYLFFRGLEESRDQMQKLRIEMPDPDYIPQSLREAALAAEKEEKKEGANGVPVAVEDPFNEGLVAAVYAAILRLEDRGYYASYHLVLGEQLWRELHTPTKGSMVLPRDRIEPTLLGGSFYRTTTLPDDEALLVSMDGPTFDCVIAGDPSQHPRFEFLRVEPDEDQDKGKDKNNGEEFYKFCVRERFAPRVRENRAVVRLKQNK